MPSWATNVYVAEVGNNEVFHAITAVDTVKKIIQTGVIKPLGGRGAVSLSTSMFAASQFGEFIFTFNWECLQKNNLGLFPLHYTNIAEHVCEEYWKEYGEDEFKFLFIFDSNDLYLILNSYLTALVAHEYVGLSDYEVFNVEESGVGVYEGYKELFWANYDSSKYDFEGEEGEVIEENYHGYVEGIVEYLYNRYAEIKQKYPYIYDVNYQHEEEIRSYSAVFVTGCINTIYDVRKKRYVSPSEFLEQY